MKKFLIFLNILILIISSDIYASIDSLAEKFYRDGIEYFSVANYKDAAENFENAINQDNDIFYLLTDKGIFEELLESKNNEVNEYIVKICNKILEKDKNNSFALFYIGWAQINIGLYVEARENLEAARSIMQKDGLNTDDIDKVIGLSGF